MTMTSRADGAPRRITATIRTSPGPRNGPRVKWNSSNYHPDLSRLSESNRRPVHYECLWPPYPGVPHSAFALADNGFSIARNGTAFAGTGPTTVPKPAAPLPRFTKRAAACARTHAAAPLATPSELPEGTTRDDHPTPPPAGTVRQGRRVRRTSRTRGTPARAGHL